MQGAAAALLIMAAFTGVGAALDPSSDGPAWLSTPRHLQGDVPVLLLNGSCEEALALEKESQRSLILNATLEAAEQWAVTTSTVSFTCLGLDLIMVVLLVALRHHRPIQSEGLGFLCCLLMGCMFGHIASLMDGLTPSAEGCRGRLALIYVFIYGLLAPLAGKIASLCRAARNASLAGNAMGWDRFAKKVTLSILFGQALILTFYLGLTANKPYREDRLQTVCSEYVSEHAFHFFDGLLVATILFAVYIAIIWLQMTPLVTAKRGTKDLLLCALAVTFGSAGLLSLLAASSQDLLSISMTTAITPTRLLITLFVAWVHVGFQVVPALFLTFQLIFERKFNPHGRRKFNRMGEDAIHKLVAMQQKQLLELESEVVERQRALRDNVLRLKLMTSPILQAWIELRTVHLSRAATAGRRKTEEASVAASMSSAPRGSGRARMTTGFSIFTDGGGRRSSLADKASAVVGESGPTEGWQKYYCRMFQNKKLVCWTDSSDAASQLPPAKVVDLFEVREAQQVVDEADWNDPSRSTRGEVQLTTKSDAVQLRFVESHSVVSKAERSKKWLETLNDMLREINMPDHPPSFHNVKVWVGTWNMGNTAPDFEQLRLWLGVEKEKHDVYAIGLQESAFALSKEQRQFGNLNTYMASIFNEALGSEYRVVEAKQMWEIRLILLAHEDMAPHLELLDAASEPTGIGGVGGNKGGVAIAISLHRTTMCFVTAHLAAHQEMTKRRNRDCVDIFKGMRNLAVSKRPGKRSLDPSVGFDHVFFFGDLNYRIAAPMEMVLDGIEATAWPQLLEWEQLREEMSKARVLCGFQESAPDFPPTFKRIKAKNGKGELPKLDRLSAIGGNDSSEDTCRYSSEEMHQHLLGGSGGGGGGKGGGKDSKGSSSISVFGAIKALKPAKGADSVAAVPYPSGLRKDASYCARSPNVIDEEQEGGEDDEGAAALNSEDAAAREGETAQRAFKLKYNAQRIPSWCDRILWRSYPMCPIEQTSCTSVEAVDTSDHTPVCSTFAVRVMLPADAESKALGDLYQWEFSVSAIELLVPLSALEDEDAAAARIEPPELLVEFGGTIIRTGYTTPPLKAALSRDTKLGAQPTLSAKFDSTLTLALTDLAQRLGPSRIALSHLIMQVVADFGQRRVILGATVFPLDTALNDPGASRELPLFNCAVDGGAMLSAEATLRDTGSRQQFNPPASSGSILGRKSTEKPPVPAGLAKWKASKKKLKALALIGASRKEASCEMLPESIRSDKVPDHSDRSSSAIDVEMGAASSHRSAADPSYSNTEKDSFRSTGVFHSTAI